MSKLMALPDRELTPTELRQLIESNSRSILAVTNAIAETNQAIANTARNLDRLEETSNSSFERLEHHLARLELTLDRYFHYQS